MPSNYDTDFYTWTQEQAALLREGAFTEIDIANLIEEVESLGHSIKSAMRSQMIRLLLHLLKWQYQPARRQDSHSWQDSITDARTQIMVHLESNHALQGFPEAVIPFAYRHARRKAAVATRLPLETFPVECPWGIDDILDDAFWPEG